MIKIGRKKIDANMLIAQEREHILSQDTDFYIRESYNTLRSNVTFSLTGKGCKIVAVTSTNPGEGKSITALNIAVAYAEINKKVLLIDFDLRKPKVHRLLKIKPTPGLSNILIDESAPGQAIQKLNKYGIDVIASGDIPPNSTQLLESEQLEELFEYVKDKYDYVILDTPPINIVIDACILAKHTSGIIYVIKQDYAKKDHILNAVKQLEFSQGRIIGFVLNDITDKSLLSFKYGHQYKKYRYEKRSHSETMLQISETGNTETKEEAPKTPQKLKEKDDKAEYEPSEKPKKRNRKRGLMILFVMIALLAGIVLAFAQHQKNNIKAFSYAGQYSVAELNQKNQELEGKIQGVVEQIPDVHITPLTEEERKQLGQGELSSQEAIAIITGTRKQASEGEEKPEEEKTEVSRTNTLIAEFYLLKAEFLNDIDNLIAQGQAERHAIPKEERTLTVKLEMAKKYAKLGSELEAVCDKKMNTLLGELEAELQVTGQSTSVIADITELYNEEKAIKKAALIGAYYPKG